VWFRRDLRVRDLPALAAAAQGDRTVPPFVLGDRLLTGGRFPSAPRTAFILGCLRELDAALRDRGGRLVVRHGMPEREVPRLAEDYRAVAG
jgi:deoxyribodipyrimidine photo-lyase